MAEILNHIDQQILDFLQNAGSASSREMLSGIGNEVSIATIKRALQRLEEAGFVEAGGQGRATRYTLSRVYNLLRPVEVDAYFQLEIDERKINTSYNHALLTEILPGVSIFSEEEKMFLESLQALHTSRTAELSDSEYRQEMERLAIDLSWKSSQIEGNTYSLLETERLLLQKETAEGKTRDEATMLLNHKESLDFILSHTDYIEPLTLRSIEDIHSLLIKDLGVKRNLRRRRVGISGTNYVPLDNEHQIRQAMDEMCVLINNRDNVFEKALLVLLIISYIQPFADGNKRTARIISNAILMNAGYCPLSFRTVDSLEYKKAMLVFYEQNNLSVFKRIFTEQFEFAVKTYF
jgi:Fic family protein